MNSSINASKIIIDDSEDKIIISQEEAEEAVKTLIRYIGEDPERDYSLVIECLRQDLQEVEAQ